jgi:uncharacterized membrane protein YtjA (UPF0391 family)
MGCVKMRWHAFYSSPSTAKRILLCRLLKEIVMLYWALVFFILAIVAGVLGFGNIAAMSAGIAQILFWLFLIIFVLALIVGLVGRRRI